MASCANPYCATGAKHHAAENRAPDMHDGIPRETLQDYRRRLGEDAFQTRLGFENGTLPFPARAFRRQNLFGFVTPLVISGARLLLWLSGLAKTGRRNLLALHVASNDVCLPALPAQFDGFRILQLSDLHIDLIPQFSGILAERIRPLHYDICVITGDFRNRTRGSCDAAVAGTLRLLPALQQPLFAVMGNHDRLSMVAPLEAHGCRFLLNEHHIISRAGAAIAIIGVDDPCVVGTHNLDHALAGAGNCAARLLFSHSPALYPELACHKIDYVFAGHTHGGQICLPGGFIPFPNDPSPRQMHRGPWEMQGVRGYTSPGTGGCGIAARFNCPPEITIHTLRRRPHG